MIVDIPDDWVPDIRSVRSVYGNPPWGGEWVNLVRRLAQLIDEQEANRDRSTLP